MECVCSLVFRCVLLRVPCVCGRCFQRNMRANYAGQEHVRNCGWVRGTRCFPAPFHAMAPGRAHTSRCALPGLTCLHRPLRLCQPARDGRCTHVAGVAHPALFHYLQMLAFQSFIQEMRT